MKVNYPNERLMVKFMYKLGFRNLNKNKTNTILNLFSLALGLTVLLLIAVFTHNELSIDSFHSNSSLIYKISYGNSSGKPGPLTRVLIENFPDIKYATHIETKQFSIIKISRMNLKIIIPLILRFSVYSTFRCWKVI